MSLPVVLWFRQDLRLSDHPALHAALAKARAAGGTLLPLYVWAPEDEAPWAPGAASRWWLHHSLAALDTDLRRLGSRLLLRRGDTLAVLRSVLAASGARTVYATRRYEPAATDRDARLRDALAAEGARLELHPGALLYEPEAVRTRQGGSYRVFTPFWRACMALGEPAAPLPTPDRLPPVPDGLGSDTLDDLGLLSHVDWAGGLRAAWTPGEAGARQRLEAFAAEGLDTYAEARDFPAEPGTARLSPHLHFGELSPREAWHPAAHRASGKDEGAAAWQRQLGWREFAHHLLHHFPHTPQEPLDASFTAFPWRADADTLHAWQRGRTGYPLVDAGMRELWATGWMHNRVRMVVGSFLVKHLLLPWQDGAAWFWDTLVDADLANNTLGWQWVGGCGADAAPYFRVFNPVRQGERFDPAGTYVRRWVPELAALPPRHVHAPWQAPAAVLTDAGVRLGATYPRPLVPHAEARARALAAYRAMRAEVGR